MLSIWCWRTSLGDLHANQPSSSSLLVGAGRGAPGDSCVGSCTYPFLPKGFRPDRVDSNGFEGFVFAGTSVSLLDQPKLFIESRNEADAMTVSTRLRHGLLQRLTLAVNQDKKTQELWTLGAVCV